MTPVLCPICTRSSLEPIFEQFTVKAEAEGEHKVGGLVAHKCTEFGHISFVRKSDVEADSKFVLGV